MKRSRISQETFFSRLSELTSSCFARRTVIERLELFTLIDLHFCKMNPNEYTGLERYKLM